MFVSLFAKQKSPLLQILYYQFIRLLKIHAPQKFRCFLVKMPPLIKHWLNRQSLSQTKIIIILSIHNRGMHDSRSLTCRNKIRHVYLVRLRMHRDSLNLKKRLVFQTDKIATINPSIRTEFFTNRRVRSANYYLLFFIILPYRILYVLPDSQNDITRKRPGSRCPSKEINRPWRTFFVSDNNNTATRVIYFHSKFYRNRLLRHVLIRIIHRNLKI